MRLIAAEPGLHKYIRKFKSTGLKVLRELFCRDKLNFFGNIMRAVKIRREFYGA